MRYSVMYTDSYEYANLMSMIQRVSKIFPYIIIENIECVRIKKNLYKVFFSCDNKYHSIIQHYFNHNNVTLDIITTNKDAPNILDKL